MRDCKSKVGVCDAHRKNKYEFLEEGGSAKAVHRAIFLDGGQRIRKLFLVLLVICSLLPVSTLTITSNSTTSKGWQNEISSVTSTMFVKRRRIQIYVI